MTRGICCRLCLAPGEECVPIFTNYAADRERLDHKIYSCVTLKVTKEDALSSHICHICISFLNSWQSFKNRCDSAEKKQRAWAIIECSVLDNNSIASKQLGHSDATYHRVSTKIIVNDDNDDAKTYIPNKNDILEKNGSTNPKDLQKIKEEQIVHQEVHDQNFEATSNDTDGEGFQSQVFATCSVCDVTFSNRANARRHERNIHGLIQNPVHQQSELDNCKSKVSHESCIDHKIKIPMRLKSKKEIYDYDNPAKYRHLITPNKLEFIVQHLDFLKQAQDMKCKCCNKSYPSYKYFMGHMRKKYANLPRNVCFKCLRQFSSKGQFIGHLKRKSCINLYAIVMNDDTISKNISSNSAAEITRMQEVISNISYGCKICNKEDLSKNGIRLHAFEMHSDILSTIENLDTQCTFCKQNFEDSDLRKSHNQNLECLLFIICGTCGERFEEQIAYMHHVNQNHMPSQQTNYDNYEFELLCQEENTSSHLRNPQNCPVCSKQYNNYYNLLRHMESKHPNQLPQIYRCRICDAGYPRQSELRAHLQTKHGEILLTQEKQKNISNFLCKECHQSYDVLFDWIDHQHVKHSRFSCVKCDFKTGNRKTFMDHWSVEHETFNTSAAKVPIYSYRKSAKWYNSIGISKKHTESTTSNKADVKIPANVYEKNIKTYAADNVDNQLNVKIIKCGICGFALIDIEALRQHMNKIHGMDKKFFYCNQCTAKFMNEKGLRVHLFRCHQVHDDAMQMNAEVFLEEPIKQNSHMIDSELKDSDSNKQKMFECNVCHAVYQNRDQLNEHMQKVHSSLDNIKNHETQNSPEALHLQQHKLWIQCRYCVNSYNSHKQILNHMKDHEEHDESDYPCKDCGDILRTKTLFWAHRYKQHSIYPDVSTCNHCSKPFFDKTELNYHTSLVHAKEANSISDANGETNEEFHLIRCEPDASFSISDTKIDNDLSLQVNCASDNVYQCDMCTKTFDVMNALQVHRGWHFRSPDGRKIRNANEVWQPDQLPPSKIKKVLHSPQLASVVNTADSLLQSGFSTCPYCYSTFPDETSLQGHIMKAHDRKETDIPIHGSFASTTLNESLNSSKRFQACSTCDVEFETLEEWIDHKLDHVRARNSPSGFILPCDICNKVFTKKDPLLRHLSSHINKSSIGQEKSNAHNKSLVFFNQNTRKMTEEDFSIEVDPLEDADDNTDNESDDCDNASNYEYNDKGYSIEKLEKYFCELCKLQFSTANTLRQHVSEHFLIENMGGYHNTP